MEGFTKEELVLPYDEWDKLAQDKKPRLDIHNRKWLKEWNLHDLINSPATDEQRKYIRLGHYAGWFDCLHDKWSSSPPNNN